MLSNLADLGKLLILETHAGLAYLSELKGGLAAMRKMVNLSNLADMGKMWGLGDLADLGNLGDLSNLAAVKNG